MSPFEFVLILVSVVAGFAVSEILSGWGRLIRERVSILEVGVHVLASSWLLLVIIRYVWVLWASREIEWRFLDFLFSFLPILVLALAAYVTNPVRASKFDPPAHYMGQSRPFCYLVALFLATWNIALLRSLIFGDGFTFSQLFGLVIALLFVVLAHVRSQIVHGVSLAAALLVVAFMSTISVTNLGAT